MSPSASHFDVIVIGLGAAGAATTYQLAKKGSRVLGIDRFDPPHVHGSTHGDTRITRLAIGEGAQYTPLAIRSHEIWRALEAQTGEHLLTQCGALYIAPSGDDSAVHGRPGFLTRTQEAADQYGIPYELLDAAAVRARFPVFNMQPHERALYEPSGGFVRPESCVRVQLALATLLGAQVHRHETFVRYEIDARGLVQVTTDCGLYTANRLVLSMGAWIGPAMPPSIASYFTVARQVLCWFEVDGDMSGFMPERCPVHIWMLANNQDLYGFPSVDGPTGGVKLATESYAEHTTADTVRRDITPEETAAVHAQFVSRCFPTVSSRLVRAATCLYTVTPRFDFIIDTMPEHAQVLVVSPCSGHGFKHSAAIGEAVAIMAMTGEKPESLRPFSMN